MSDRTDRRIERVAVLGLGSIGLRHAGNARDQGRAVIGYDPSADACGCARDQGVEIATCARDALATADAVVIASPSGRHLDDLEAAIAAQCPALVEKPIGHDPDRTAALLARAEADGVPVGAAFNLRRRSVVEALHGTVVDRIGAPVWARFVSASWLPDWRPEQDYRTGYASDPQSGGVVFDVIHELDLAVHMIGPAEVAASVLRRSGRLELPVEDGAEIVLRHAYGCLSSLHLDFASPVRRRALEICGLHGSVEADLRSGETVWRDAGGERLETATVAIDPDAEYRAVLADFLDAIERGVAPECDGAAGLAALHLAHRARIDGEMPA